MRTDVALRPIGDRLERQRHRPKSALGYAPDVRLKGFGNFRLDFLLYKLVGVDLGNLSDATLGTLELPPKIILPFLVMIVISLITRRNTEHALNRYYAKMKTPVTPDREQDEQEPGFRLRGPRGHGTEKAVSRHRLRIPEADSGRCRLDSCICVGACFAIIGAAVFAASLGQ